MKDSISILMGLTPRYGEILIGIGAVALIKNEELLENLEARQKLKEYLKKDALKKANITEVMKSYSFQNIIYNYTKTKVEVGVMRDNKQNDKIVNVLMIDFFIKAMWPKMVEKYIDNICIGGEAVCFSLNVKRNVYFTIYGEYVPNLFFDELKEYLLYNSVIISEATVQDNGDILLNLIIPIAPVN